MPAGLFFPWLNFGFTEGQRRAGLGLDLLEDSLSTGQLGIK